MKQPFFLKPIAFALFLALLLCADRYHLQAQSCPDPINVQALIVNATCGNATGAVILSVAGGNTGLSFSWTPNVASGSSAVDLPAGVYAVRIQRNAQPTCLLDTTFVVTNTNGPAIQINQINPAQCNAADGSISLGPASLQFSWSTGESGAVNTDLAAGCYFVTATNNAGCSSVQRICVPGISPLNTNVIIIEQAKCNRPNGRAEIQVSGGSGSYSYSLPGAPNLLQLPPGNYTCQVTDNNTGCTDVVAFSINNRAISANVNLQTFNVRCPGEQNGFVVFDVQPGANFELPFSFSLRSASGQAASPGNLAPGFYDLFIVDADSCALPTSSFVISQPPPLNVQSSAMPATCAQGGSINLQISGGNGAYFVDWPDLPGTQNPVDRIQLKPGIYHPTIFDSLFCAYTPLPIRVNDLCATPDTLHRFVAADQTVQICLPAIPGVNAGALQYTLQGGGSSGSSVYGSWSLLPGGCLVYTANSATGFGLDVICLNQSVGNEPGLSNSICVVISITPNALVAENVPFTVQAGSAVTVCGPAAINFPNPKVVLLDRAGLSGSSGNFGTYTVNPTTACLNFTALDDSAFNVDNICVGVMNPADNSAFLICYIPSVLPKVDCGAAILEPDSLRMDTDFCTGLNDICFDIPYAEILDYNILLDGQNYSAGSVGCNTDTLITYQINLQEGSYQLTLWKVGTQTFSGTFGNLQGLLVLLRQLDPDGNWRLEGSNVLVGGRSGVQYSNLNLRALPSGGVFIIQAGFRLVPQGSVLRFLPGAHELIVKHIQSGCADTLQLTLNCSACPAIHPYTPDPEGNFIWKVSDCDADTVFCTNIPSGNLNQYSITDHGVNFNQFVNCNGNIGLLLDTGYHAIRILDRLRACTYEIPFFSQCGNLIGRDSILLTLFENQPDTLCFEPADLPAPYTTLTKICPDDFPVVATPLAGQTNCVLLSASTTGTATLCYELCNAEGACYEIYVFVTVLPDFADRVLVNNAISPNGDGANDEWIIDGIEQYPDNHLQVFNRWGNQVFEQKSYRNDAPWNGEWSGRPLPEGVYYYVLQLGDGGKPISGWLWIQR